MNALKFWLETAEKRIAEGRSTYGKWKAKDGRILRFEAALEIIDATAYMAAASFENQYDKGDDIEGMVVTKQARMIQSFFDRGVQIDACGWLQSGFGEWHKKEGG